MCFRGVEEPGTCASQEKPGRGYVGNQTVSTTQEVYHAAKLMSRMEFDAGRMGRRMGPVAAIPRQPLQKRVPTGLQGRRQYHDVVTPWDRRLS